MPETQLFRSRYQRNRWQFLRSVDKSRDRQNEGTNHDSEHMCYMLSVLVGDQSVRRAEAACVESYKPRRTNTA